MNTHDPHGTSRLVGRSNHRHYWPLVRGGQGRSARAVTDSAEVWGWLVLAAVILALACLTGCVCDTPEHKLQNMTQGN